MSSSRSARTRVIALVAVAVFGAAACVDQKPAGVAIKSLKSDIVFGLNPPPAPPPGVAPSVSFDFGLPPLVRPPINKKPESCPRARRGDSVAAIATKGVDVRPVPGLYQWKVNGTIDYQGTPVPILSQFIEREITDVSEVTTTTTPVGGNPPTEPIVTRTFTYKMRAKLGYTGQDGTQVATFQVRDNPLVIDAGTTAANIGKAIPVGDPARGIVLTSIENYNAAGKLMSTFAPTPGILLLPLSVSIGENYQSVSVDPNSGAVVVHDGTVGNRTTVDACGTLVDGWKVTSREYFINSAGAATVAEYDYIIATELGGILVYEHTLPPDLTNVPVPTPPVIPGNPLPNLPPIPTTIPPLPVDLPTTKDNVEFSIAHVTPKATP
ncbi:MAG TPA: hypothetical protein VFB78_12720 [Acidimicrobiales bacterium]|nr:hypothetical protein [Acidimicrobiales bacterium]